ncbi:MAG: hypothetical protein ACM31C_16470 [Acidobacteriota bacterium]
MTNLHRGAACIGTSCAVEDLQFHFTVWYENLDLDELARVYGDELIDRLAFHVALFQLNAVCSLRPDVIELGPWARWLTPELAALWQTVFRNVWGQWRWEHDLPDYLPQFADAPHAAPPPARVPDGPTELLAFCGGGKDSLVALKLLERAQLPFATLGYAHSIYGGAAHQHALLDRVGGASARVRAERQWIYDDFLDSPVIELHGARLGVKSLLAAETPASLFAALPLALARGYRGLVLAHEASANAENLIWTRDADRKLRAEGALASSPQESERINHQWGKSWEAEQLLDSYVRAHLLANVRYFSVLAPVHDEVIFELLARDGELAPLTHSCNLNKPWCGDCAKCAYVWLQFAAHLPADVVARTFGDNFGERPGNARHFEELLGLAEHTPFECVGSAPESRLALALARDKGALGPRLAALAARCGAIDVPELARPLVALGDPHGMPAHVAAAVMPVLADAAAAAAKRLAG